LTSFFPSPSFHRRKKETLRQKLRENFKSECAEPKFVYFNKGPGARIAGLSHYARREQTVAHTGKGQRSLYVLEGVI
jgi:hypothetical protein